MKADWFTIIQKRASKTKNNENESGFAHWPALLYTGEGYAPSCLYNTVRFSDALQMFRVTQQRVEGHSAGKRPELLTKSINALLLVIFTDWGRPLK